MLKTETIMIKSEITDKIKALGEKAKAEKRARETTEAAAAAAAEAAADATDKAKIEIARMLSKPNFNRMLGRAIDTYLKNNGQKGSTVVLKNHLQKNMKDLEIWNSWNSWNFWK